MENIIPYFVVLVLVAKTVFDIGAIIFVVTPDIIKGCKDIIYSD